MRLLKFLSFCIIYNLIICGFIEKCTAQNKFEFGVRLDGLVMPINIDTYHDSGPGYYDINGKGNITQAAYADFTYWPHPNVGFSLGMGMRNFSSEIDYTIPDPSNEANGDVVFDNSYPFRAEGLGPIMSILFRKDRFRTRLGYSVFDINIKKFTSSNVTSSVTVFDGPETIAHILLEEVSFWHAFPTIYDILQFDAQYNILKNVFIKFGFETTVSDQNFNLYTLKISGFTENTKKEDQLLNDFKMRNTYASYSVGVGYIIGFGKYNRINK
jgi:hypothetical protein